jgi:hypothetical protein
LTGQDFASQAGHWYKTDGTPAYTMIGKNGKERAVTLRDARTLGLLPSVSTILRLEAKPQLERWKIEQACLACLTLPRSPDEDLTDFMARALKDSQEQSRKAAERGTYIHGLIEKSIPHGACMWGDENDRAIVDAVLLRLKTLFPFYDWNPERSFAAAKFGGKIDLHGVAGNEAVVIDFKTKSKLDPDKKLAYAEHCAQLAAYAYGLGAPIARCMNFFVDTDRPGLIVVHEWTRLERDKGWVAFGHLLNLWYCRNDLH